MTPQTKALVNDCSIRGDREARTKSVPGPTLDLHAATRDWTFTACSIRLARGGEGSLMLLYLAQAGFVLRTGRWDEECQPHSLALDSQDRTLRARTRLASPLARISASYMSIA